LILQINFKSSFIFAAQLLKSNLNYGKRYKQVPGDHFAL
jgi:hypothetical protein